MDSTPGDNDARADTSPLIYAGVDEAGYGPMLGPLCVGVSVFRVNEWSPGAPAPDLWRALAPIVCKEASEARRPDRIAINDSKRLKGSQGPGDVRALAHLERAVLCVLACAGERADTDEVLLRAMGVDLGVAPWYAGPPNPLPFNAEAGACAVLANSLHAAMHRAGVECLALRVHALHEGAFNDQCDAQGSKASVNFALVARALQGVWKRWGATDESDDEGGVRIVVDRQGGRAAYGAALRRAFPGASIETLEETHRASRYRVRGDAADGRPRTATILFQPEAESSHLPVALASMAAKLAREVAMLRFNRHWVERKPGLAPTAGYVTDARRWLRDAADAISPAERRQLVRRK